MALDCCQAGGSSMDGFNALEPARVDSRDPGSDVMASMGGASGPPRTVEEMVARLAILEAKTSNMEVDFRIAVQLEVKDLVERLAKTEQRLDNALAQLGVSETKGSSANAVAVADAAPGSPDEATEEIKMIKSSGTNSVEVLDLNVANTYSFQESTWDAFLFVGVADSNRMDSFFVLLSGFISFAFQFAFCLIVLSSMTGDPLTDEAVQDLLQWRLFTGHSVEYYDFLTDTSLVARVCSGSMALSRSAQQSDAFANLDQFLAATPSYDWVSAIPFVEKFGGQLLSLLCLALWALAIIKEMNNIRKFSLAISMKLSGKTEVDYDGEQFVLKGISRKRYFFVFICAIVPRFIIGILLCVSGVLFLGHTTSMADLLLNALALTFILDIDDILFEAIVPMSTRTMLSRMEAVEISKASHSSNLYRYVDVPVVCTLFLVFVFLFVTQTVVIAPFVSHMQVAHKYLCNGNVDFVFAMDSGTDLLHYAQTSSMNRFDLNNVTGTGMYLTAALTQLTSLDTTHLALPKGDRHMVEHANGNIVKEIRLTLPQDNIDRLTCANLFENPSRGGNYTELDLAALDTLYFQLGSRVKTCADVRAHCHGTYRRSIRAFCPETCGCDDPLAGIVDLDGCSSRCAAKRQGAINEVARKTDCEDNEVENLTNMSGWTRYFVQLEEQLTKNEVLEVIYTSLSITNLTDEALTSGCDLVASLLEASSSLGVCDQSSEYTGSAAAFCPGSCGIKCPPAPKAEPPSSSPPPAPPPSPPPGPPVAAPAPGPSSGGSSTPAPSPAPGPSSGPAPGPGPSGSGPGSNPAPR